MILLDLDCTSLQNILKAYFNLISFKVFSSPPKLSIIKGQGKITAPLSANVNVLSAFRHSQPAGTKLTSYWGGRKYVAESGKWSR